MQYIIIVIAVCIIAIWWAVWYFAVVPAKQRRMEEMARSVAEKEAEVIKEKKLLEVKEEILSKRTELEKVGV